MGFNQIVKEWVQVDSCKRKSNYAPIEFFNFRFIYYAKSHLNEVFLNSVTLWRFRMRSAVLISHPMNGNLNFARFIVGYNMQKEINLLTLLIKNYREKNTESDSNLYSFPEILWNKREKTRCQLYYGNENYLLCVVGAADNIHSEFPQLTPL